METITIGSRIFEVNNDELRILIFNTKGKLQKGIRFSSEEEILSYLEAQRSQVARNTEWAKEHKENTRIAKEEMVAKLKVGDILVYSRGYSITSVSFFQITQKKGKKVEIKAIGGRMDEEAGGGPFSYFVFPVKDDFLEEASEYDGWHLVTSYGIKLGDGHASLTNEGSSHYRSYSD